MLKQVCLFLIAFFLSIAGCCQENCYIVKKGDCLLTIAKQYGLTLEDLKRWNNLSSDAINTGQELLIVDPQTIQEALQESLAQEQLAEIGIRNKASLPKVDSNQGLESPLSPPASDSNPRSYSWVWLLLGMLMGGTLGVLLYYHLFIKKLKAEYKRKENELSQANANLFSMKSSYSNELSQLRSKVQNLEREKQGLFDENVLLGEKIDRMKEAQSRVNENKIGDTAHISANQASSQTTGSPTTLYADAIIDDCFVKLRKIPDEDSIFILHLSGENSADFSIHKSAYQRVLANPSFLEGCEKQIVGDNMQLEIVSEGKAQRETLGGNWKVITKLNVIIK